MTAPAPHMDDLWDRLVAVVEELRPVTGTPGVALGLSSGSDTRTWCVGTTRSGDTETMGPETIGPDTRFRWCSITKVVVAETALRVLADHDVEVDTPVREIMPDLPRGVFEPITVRMLLAHSSGLEGEWPGSLDEFGSDEGALDRLVESVGRLRVLAAPGAHFGYCNPGWWILAAALERISGVRSEQLVRRVILDPLGLHRTTTEAERPMGGAPQAGDASPHVFGVGGSAPGLVPPMPRARFASGGLSGSLADALTFGSHVLQEPGRLFGTAVGSIAADRPGRRQGLGWVVDEREGGTGFGHSGYHGGFSSQLQLDPRTGATMAFLGNSDTSYVIRDRLAEEFLTATLGAPPADSAGVADLGRFLGDYEFPFADGLTLAEEAGELVIEFRRGADAQRHVAARQSGSVFVIDDGTPSGTRIQLLPDDDDERPAIRINAALAGKARAHG